MLEVKLDIEEGIPTITGLPEGVKVVVRSIDQDSDMHDVLETTHELVDGEITQTKVDEYDLADPEES
jgi:hypothetical protein